MSRSRARPLAGLLLCLASALPGAAQEQRPAVHLYGVEVLGMAASVATRQEWTAGLLEHWQERFGAWAALDTEAPAAQQADPGATKATVRIEGSAEGLRVRVSLRPQGGQERSSQAAVWARDLSAGLQAAAGELAFLLGSGAGFPRPSQRPPRLASVVSLESLRLLRDAGGGRLQPSEALALAASAEGVRILLADRFLSLGPLLELTPQTAADLLFAPPFPANFVPALLSANALGEPLVYDARSGALLLYASGGEPPQRFDTALLGPPQTGALTGALSGGGLALLQGRRLQLLRRRGEGLQGSEILLPTGLAGALSAEPNTTLAVYDLAERRIRLLDHRGQEVGSIKPLLEPHSLPVPQVFRMLARGGFLLGGAGDLWSFSSTGLPRWRLRELGLTPREALPAFYDVQTGRGAGGSEIYLLDPLGRRLLKLLEPSGAPAQALEGQASATLEGLLADGYERLAVDPDGRAELIGLCLREGLLLQAHYLFAAGETASQASRGLEERLLEKQAQQLARLARELEEQLRLPEAERAYNRALALVRELRGIDPVERRFPRTIDELTEARNAVRQVTVAEALLEAGPAAVTPARPPTYELSLELRSRSSRRLEELTLEARAAVGPGAPAFLQRRWNGSLGSLAPGGAQKLVLPLSGVEASGAAEDLNFTVHLVLRYRQDGLRALQHLRVPVVLRLGGEAASAGPGEHGP